MTGGGTWLSPGPLNFEESMQDWIAMQKKALAEHAPESQQCLESMETRGMVVTTHYSGTGAAEQATETVLPGNVHFHGACDINPTCQRVLLSHDPECAAEHVFSDLLARPPKDIVDRLQATLAEYQEKAQVRASTPNGQDRDVLRAVGLEWVDAAMQILGEWTPTREDTAHCLRHDGNCPTFPARTSASTPGRRFHLEISGINCQPWSYAGKRMGWLDDRSIPCLILIQTILSVQPDAVCIECTPGFDFATLRRLLRGYRGDYAITSPVDFGYPVSRKRMYMWFDRMRSLQRIHREVSTILDICRRSLLVGPEIFLQASPEQIQREYYRMAQKVGALTPDRALTRGMRMRRIKKKQAPPCKLRVRDILPAGLRKRYLEHRERVEKVRTLRETCYMRDINRTAGWGGAPQCQSVPTIMRTSTLVAMFESEDDDRLLLPSELPGIHGIRIPADVLQSLQPKDVRSLVGNSMHVAQIGTFVGYALSTRSYYDD